MKARSVNFFLEVILPIACICRSAARFRDLKPAKDVVVSRERSFNDRRNEWRLKITPDKPEI